MGKRYESTTDKIFSDSSPLSEFHRGGKAALHFPACVESADYGHGKRTEYVAFYSKKRKSVSDTGGGCSSP